MDRAAYQASCDVEDLAPRPGGPPVTRIAVSPYCRIPVLPHCREEAAARRRDSRTAWSSPAASHQAGPASRDPRQRAAGAARRLGQASPTRARGKRHRPPGEGCCRPLPGPRGRLELELLARQQLAGDAHRAAGPETTPAPLQRRQQLARGSPPGRARARHRSHREARADHPSQGG
jgi:hypothetical protein